MCINDKEKCADLVIFQAGHCISFSFMLTKPWRTSYLSLLFSGTLHSLGYIFSFFLCLSLLFFLSYLLRPSQTTTLSSCISFGGGMVLVITSCTMLQTSVHSSSATLSTRSSPLNLSPPLYNHKQFECPNGFPVLWPPHVKSWLIGKDSDAGRDWGQEEKGMTEDEMAGWHNRLDGHEFEWTPGVGDGQGGLGCCDSWGRKESDTTERLNWTELNGFPYFLQIESEFYNKELMIWATVSSRSCFADSIGLLHLPLQRI